MLILSGKNIATTLLELSVQSISVLCLYLTVNNTVYFATALLRVKSSTHNNIKQHA